MSQHRSSLSQLALQKFKTNIWGVLSFWFVVCIGMVSVFAYVLAPDDSQNANQMHLTIHSKTPGFEVTMLTIPSQLETGQNFFSRLFFGTQNTDTEIPITDYRIENGNLIYTEYASDGLEGVVKEIPLTSFPESNYQKFIRDKTFLFGTDKYGRDYLSRILIGARISFFIGFIAVFISLVIGVVLGSLAGYFGGK